MGSGQRKTERWEDRPYRDVSGSQGAQKTSQITFRGLLVNEIYSLKAQLYSLKTLMLTKKQKTKKKTKN